MLWIGAILRITLLIHVGTNSKQRHKINELFLIIN